MEGSTWTFIGLVFFAVFVLVQGLVVPVFGEAKKTRKRLLARLGTVAASSSGSDFRSLLRQKHLKELTPLERSLETLPGMERLSRLVEQSGSSVPANRLLILSVVLAVVGALLGWSFTRMPLFALLGAVVGMLLPTMKIIRDRGKRFAKFEEQLPDALDVVKRALKAGHPFAQALKLVAEDMEDPIAREFDLVFSEINYGGDMRSALMGLMERMPSVSVMALVTAVLVQKETGGNLAETFERISAVIRGRFKLYRRVRTLSAEGRLSAWILSLVPLALVVAVSVTTPDYLPVMFKDPLGKNLCAAAVVLGLLGVMWIRRIIRIEV